MPYQVEKTVFISYRRTNIFFARAIFQSLRSNGYDVFLDYESIDAGAFGQIILNQIKARAHFLVLLTPSALERCSEPGDWLRREIETAIEEKRNVVPLYFEGFDFAEVKKYLPNHLHILSNYNALRIPSDYFDAAMERLRNHFLNIPLELVIHPTPAAEKPIVEKKTAQQAAEPTVEKDKLTASEYFERANQAANNGDNKSAIHDYNEAIQLDASNYYYFNNRGVAHRYIGNYSLAISDYEKAAKINSEIPNAFNNIGDVELIMGNYERAIEHFNRAIEIDSNEYVYFKNRAEAYSAIAEYAMALEDYEKAMELSSSDSATIAGLATVQFTLGHIESGVSIWRGLVYENINHLDADWVGRRYDWPPTLIEEAHTLIKTLKDTDNT